MPSSAERTGGRYAAALLALLLAGPLAARDPAIAAREAAAAGLPAISVFVDVDWGAREDGAAAALTRTHGEFARHGYVLVDVETYLENGDLQGFFVSYRRRAADPGSPP